MNNLPIAALQRALASRVNPQMGQVAEVQVQVHNRVTDKMGNRHRAVKPAARADHRLPQREAPWWPQEPKALGRVPRVD